MCVVLSKSKPPCRWLSSVEISQATERQSLGTVWKSRLPSWAPVPNKPTVRSVTSKFDTNGRRRRRFWRSTASAASPKWPTAPSASFTETYADAHRPVGILPTRPSSVPFRSTVLLCGDRYLKKTSPWWSAPSAMQHASSLATTGPRLPAASPDSSGKPTYSPFKSTAYYSA